MTQVTVQMAAQMRQLIFYHLDNESVDNANFLAGRLHALDPRNADSHHLLSLTYLRLRRYKAAYDAAYKYGYAGKNLGCAYVFALSCEALGKHTEGISALEKSKPLWSARNSWNKHSDTSRKHLPDAAAVFNLLGKLWRGHGDLRKSGESFIEAHKANPFTWDAFQGLCDIGADVNVANSFRMSAEMKSSQPVSTATTNGIKEDPYIAAQPMPAQVPEAHTTLSTPMNDPFSTSVKTGGEWSFQFPKIKAKGMFGSPPKASAHTSWETPTANCGPGDDDVEMGGISHDIHGNSNDAPPPAPVRRSKTLSRLGFDSSKDTSRLQAPNLKSLGRSNSETTEGDDSASQATRATIMHKRTLSGNPSNATTEADTAPPRRSNRLFGQLGSSKTSSRLPTEATSINGSKRDADLKKAKATGTKGRGTSTVGRVVSGNRKVLPPTTDSKDSRAPSRNSVAIPSAPSARPPPGSVVLLDTAAIESLLVVFKQLAIGYSALAKYDSKASIKAFESISPAQKETSWVLAQLGKAYYEAAEYAKAEECFERMIKIQPTRVEDTEYYSTVLWQLKRPVQLAFLAHTLRELDFEAPQTWCTIGNAFSLNREHDRAITCFKRATQLNPKFYYAWTLMGHELLTNEEFDAALSAYRKGVGGERRGYASWYGLGKCYERMGRFEEAERHYRIAASINKQNAVLFVCIGVVLERMRHPREALVQYAHAVTLAPTSVLAHFRRARALMTLQLYNEALAELTELVTLAPEEANVWYLLGRCHKALGNRSETVKCYTTSLNLDAKAAPHIKEAMEAIDDSDEDDDSD
ncbi:TPR-like protein [Myriangium duriaei CBS 260.36]|uniref:TPR-like protein n=1 Tax=Myriangium duriaei CBS 260.36 TaxID=1168546 RepID=A0A9P4J3X0_9PEZI|nr:TPR-like protein [Myriangium duriaei CBS 260.36]